MSKINLSAKKPSLLTAAPISPKSQTGARPPHIYKINGTYYLLCAEGGTETNHSAVIFKSDSIKGPYVSWEKNPILTARDLPDDRSNPVTCTGHADFVQTQNGEWFAVFLACQPYLEGHFNTGRQTFLLPVTWENEWPVILPPNTPVPLTVKNPNLPAGKAPAIPSTGNIAFTETFDSETLAARWIGLRVPTSTWYATSKTAKALYLEPRSDHFSGQGNPSFLAVRQQNNDYECTVTLKAQPATVDCIAGLVAFQNERSYYAVNVKTESGRLVEISIEQPAARSGRGFRGGGEPTPPTILATQKLQGNVAAIDIKIEGAGPVTRIYYRTGNGEFMQLGDDLESSYLSTVSAGGFQGVTLGMFARN
ncbi:family 43 glycosylhydrolase [Candidatus Latescibacterota bacterium]